MNIQTNVQEGLIKRYAGEDLTGKEGRLVKLVLDATYTTGVVKLPAAITDSTPYVLEEGAVSGQLVTLRPMDGKSNIRILAKNTGSAGGLIVPAAIAGDDAGKVRADAAGLGGGSSKAIGIAEQDFVDGQMVLVRPVLSLNNVTLTT